MKFGPTFMGLEARTVPTVDPTGYDPNAAPVPSTDDESDSGAGYRFRTAGIGDGDLKKSLTPTSKK